MSNADNPRAVIGANAEPDAPDYSALTVERLAREYAEVIRVADGLLEEARALPPEIDNDDTKALYTHLIKRIRDVTKRLEAYHAKEKEPFFRSGQGCDQLFFGVIDKLARRDKKAKSGAADILNARLTDYDVRKLAEENERRRLESERLRREADAAAAIAAEELRRADEARLAAERARNPVKIEEKAAVAVAQEDKASAAIVDAKVTETAAEEARIATMARPADIMRTRSSFGTLSTMGEEKYADVVDAEKLDKDKLWPFISLGEKQKALRAWAATTGHTAQMPGASVGKRPKSKVL